MEINSNFIRSGNGWRESPKVEGVSLVECQNWLGFIEFLHDEKTLRNNQGYCFRGQSSETWDLKSTLKRQIQSDDVSQLTQIETDVLTRFKKYCIGRRGLNPRQLEDNEYWALGQHYGLNTPLLDWTDSPYVAAFFAFHSDNSDTENVVVWALSKSVDKEINNDENLDKLQFLDLNIDENARLINQKGLFVRTPNMECVETYANSIADKPYVVLAKILIPKSERIFALDSLDKMNISSLTLFPDLTGAAHFTNYIQKRDCR
ncbi:FRG domain-containing protein [Rheinheimera sp. 1928-s]|uniref:FRG domain-containing protein n=1 Tax=Rheinheimera sp. 1928-s TaxID=3033803 RepID=UPI00261C34E4|nr:FRG domain-containing protein [Rheinheimera sp. 1928-s]MDF3126116.1 FRG domain-containing protein [Rheinheimera sp. 1928-s]